VELTDEQKEYMAKFNVSGPGGGAWAALGVVLGVFTAAGWGVWDQAHPLQAAGRTLTNPARGSRSATRRCTAQAEREEKAAAKKEGLEDAGKDATSFFHGKEAKDYQGRSWLEPAKDRKKDVPEAFFLPKKWVGAAWEGGGRDPIAHPHARRHPPTLRPPCSALAERPLTHLVPVASSPQVGPHVVRPHQGRQRGALLPQDRPHAAVGG
jgi:hypothetical protein